MIEASRRAGAADSQLIDQPMAAAIGAGLPIHEPLGNMVVDIGGGTTEVAVISLGGNVHLEAIRVGSFDIDAAIQTYVRREYGIAIGERTAEEIKMAIGSAAPTEDEVKAEVRGRDLMSGLPKTVCSRPRRCGTPSRSRSVPSSRRSSSASAACPPELAQDLIGQGIHLVGGGAMLRGLDLRLSGRDGTPRAPRRRAPAVRRPRRRQVPRGLRDPEGHVHGTFPLLVARRCRWYLAPLSGGVAAALPDRSSGQAFGRTTRSTRRGAYERRSSAAWRTCQSRSVLARSSAASTSGPSKAARASTARRRTVGLSRVPARIALSPARRRSRRVRRRRPRGPSRRRGPAPGPSASALRREPPARLRPSRRPRPRGGRCPRTQA